MPHDVRRRRAAPSPLAPRARALVAALLGLVLAPLGGCAAEPDEVGASTVNALSVSIGYDPGMNAARAVGIGLEPNEGSYDFEFCSDAPGGSCAGLPLSEGWYNLAAGMDWYDPIIERDRHFSCAPVPHAVPFAAHTRHTLGPAHALHLDVPCPYSFDWLRGADGRLSALMTVDTTGYGRDSTPNNGIAIQLNNLGAGPRAGIDFYDVAKAPPLEDIDFVRFEYRASVCDPRADGFYLGRGLYYLDVWNPSYPDPETGEDGYGVQIAVNFFEYLRGVPRAEVDGALVIGIEPQDKMVEEGSDGFSATWQIEGRPLLGTGLRIEGGAYDLAPDPACRPAPDGAWTTVTIDMNWVLRALAEHPQFLDDPAFLEGARYSGGIIGGAEMWGRGTIHLEVRGHTLYENPSSPPMLTGPYTPAAGGVPEPGVWRDAGGRHVLMGPDGVACDIRCLAELGHYVESGHGPARDYPGSLATSGVPIVPSCPGSESLCAAPPPPGPPTLDEGVWRDESGRHVLVGPDGVGCDIGCWDELVHWVRETGPARDYAGSLAASGVPIVGSCPGTATLCESGAPPPASGPEPGVWRDSSDVHVLVGGDGGFCAISCPEELAHWVGETGPVRVWSGDLRASFPVAPRCDGADYFCDAPPPAAGPALPAGVWRDATDLHVLSGGDGPVCTISCPEELAHWVAELGPLRTHPGDLRASGVTVFASCPGFELLCPG